METSRKTPSRVTGQITNHQWLWGYPSCIGWCDQPLGPLGPLREAVPAGQIPRCFLWNLRFSWILFYKTNPLTNNNVFGCWCHVFRQCNQLIVVFAAFVTLGTKVLFWTQQVSSDASSHVPSESSMRLAQRGSWKRKLRSVFRGLQLCTRPSPKTNS